LNNALFDSFCAQVKPYFLNSPFTECAFIMRVGVSKACVIKQVAGAQLNKDALHDFFRSAQTFHFGAQITGTTLRFIAPIAHPQVKFGFTIFWGSIHLPKVACSTMP